MIKDVLRSVKHLPLNLLLVLKEGLKNDIFIQLTNKYIGKIELAFNAENIEVRSLEFDNIELDAKTKNAEFTAVKNGIGTSISYKTDIKKTNCKRGKKYCILLYNEKKGNYLQNIG